MAKLLFLRFVFSVLEGAFFFIEAKQKCLTERHYVYVTNVSLLHFQRKVLRPRCVAVGLWKGRTLFRFRLFDFEETVFDFICPWGF